MFKFKKKGKIFQKSPVIVISAGCTYVLLTGYFWEINITENKKPQPTVRTTRKNIQRHKVRKIWLMRIFYWQKKLKHWGKFEIYTISWWFWMCEKDGNMTICGLVGSTQLKMFYKVIVPKFLFKIFGKVLWRNSSFFSQDRKSTIIDSGIIAYDEVAW